MDHRFLVGAVLVLVASAVPLMTPQGSAADAEAQDPNFESAGVVETSDPFRSADNATFDQAAASSSQEAGAGDAAGGDAAHRSAPSGADAAGDTAPQAGSLRGLGGTLPVPGLDTALAALSLGAIAALAGGRRARR